MRFLLAIGAIAFLAPMAFSDDETEARVRVALALAAASKSAAVPGCLCGCVQTGNCVCPNCDHPVKGTPTGKGCICGCVATGTCVCKDCNHPMMTPIAAPPLSYADARALAIREGKPLVAFVGVPELKMGPGYVTCSVASRLSYIMIGCPDGKGDLDRLDDLPSNSGLQQILRAIEMYRPAQRRSPVGAYVPPLRTAPYQNCGPRG